MSETKHPSICVRTRLVWPQAARSKPGTISSRCYFCVVLLFQTIQLGILFSSFTREFQRGFGVGSQQTGELAGIFYCFLWQRTTSSSSVCAVSQVCCSRPQISVLKHMRQTALGNSCRPLQALLVVFCFFSFIDGVHFDNFQYI